MLSVPKCRQILGNSCSITDEELKALRDQLYGLANVSVTAFSDQLRSNKLSLNSPHDLKDGEINES
jgi:hypothetical protein